ncbi:DUF2267 domain-containing protein [Salinisphaera sp.]|uniref:DUF2267 domain-containing protein n=1 Tax=Salinisphaera sp. TaxID=1914330 RepID=UPI002D79DAF4|nr:DUF2267 domain-containing protein [Salinisphaera sp.]HET7313385.1 DUF2267 domain-containing protein [Salinisphaera sp.]
MQTEEFVNEVARAADLSDHDAALAISRATVETICAHLPAEQVRKLSSQLPQELTRAAEAGRTQTTEKPAEISLDAFFEQVAVRAERERSEVEPAARAAITVFKRALTRGETTDVVLDAPRELDALLTG